jgi:hypothetical protein
MAYVLNLNSQVIHRPDCHIGKKATRTSIISDETQAHAYEGCKDCAPFPPLFIGQPASMKVHLFDCPTIHGNRIWQPSVHREPFETLESALRIGYDRCRICIP